jgi:hypothetical protein
MKPINDAVILNVLKCYHYSTDNENKLDWSKGKFLFLIPTSFLSAANIAFNGKKKLPSRNYFLSYNKKEDILYVQ